MDRRRRLVCAHALRPHQSPCDPGDRNFPSPHVCGPGRCRSTPFGLVRGVVDRWFARVHNTLRRSPRARTCLRSYAPSRALGVSHPNLQQGIAKHNRGAQAARGQSREGITRHPGPLALGQSGRVCREGGPSPEARDLRACGFGDHRGGRFPRYNNVMRKR